MILPQSQFQEVAEILKSQELSKSIFRLTLLAPDISRIAVPGQFVMVRVGEGFDPLLRRPFSIHQTGVDGQLQILFRVVGKGTRELSLVQAGGTMDLVGPLGNGFPILPRTTGKICIVGGGMGIAPLLFLAKRLKSQDSCSELRIVLGASTASELVGLDDFRALEKVRLLIATDDGSLGYHGLVTELLENDFSNEASWRLMTCGPLPMMQAVARIAALKGWECFASLECMMACGISACLGCVVERRSPGGHKKYWHVCKDGPVFNVKDLRWNRTDLT